ncbi:hypothetical protein GCM10027612_07090 [Microbispora bryophytorum subsp. camponoti]
MAEALAEVPRPAPAPVTTAPPALNLRSEAPDGLGRSTMPPRVPSHLAHQMAMTSPPPLPPRPQTGAASKVLLTVIVLLVMAAVGVGAWTVGKNLGNTPRGVAQSDSGASPSPPASRSPSSR